MKFYTKTRISENMRLTPEGFLLCLGVPIARAGEMTYGEGETPLETKDGKIVITRDIAEISRPETIASFQGKAFTLLHPDDFVNSENWSELAKGTLHNVRAESEDLLADIMITNQDAIDKVLKENMREVSCGYEAEYIQIEPGRGKQTNIIGNHLALVDQGRAGPAYAINDHKGDQDMKLTDRIKAIFAKAQDEALKAAAEGGAGEVVVTPATPPAKTADAPATYDELVKVINGLSEKVEAMGGKTPDASASPAAGGAGEVVQGGADEGGEGAATVEARLTALEQKLDQLLAAASATGDEESDEEEETEDADEDDETEDSDDDEDKESAKTGDAARAEILAPGIKLGGKDLRVRALKAAYATQDGKTVIHKLTGKKAPAYDNATSVDTLFVAVSELLKEKRSSDLSRSKTVDAEALNEGKRKVVSAEDMNKINQKHWQKSH